MSDIRIFPGYGERDPDAMLEVAKSADLDRVLIIGWSGDSFFFSASHDVNTTVLWDLEMAKTGLLNGEF